MPATRTQAPRPLREGLEDISNKASGFWREVTDGLALEQLWETFKREAHHTYKLYSADVARSGKLEALPRQHRGWAMTKAFFWAVLMKLSPPRRVALLIALVFWILPEVTIGNLTLHPEGFHFWSLVLLLGLLVAEVADRVTMKRDLEIAREIQGWLVPEAAPAVPGYDFAFTMRPANTVAGDYYDLFRRAGTPERVLIAVADVAGKSMPAALLMAAFQASLRTLAATDCTLPEMLAGLNRHASARSQQGRRFTTAFIAELEPASGALSYINAGHNAPVLRRASGALERLEGTAVPLGINPEASYECRSAQLAAGDLLVIFTDGLPEAVNPREQEYGEERLLALVSSNLYANANELLRMLMSDVARFTGGAAQNDDITCVLVARQPAAGAPPAP